MSNSRAKGLNKVTLNVFKRRLEVYGVGYKHYDRIFTSFMTIRQRGYTVCVALRQSFERKPTGTGAFWKNGRFMSDWELAVAPYVKQACNAARRK